MTKEEIIEEIKKQVNLLDSWVGRASLDGILCKIEIKDF